MPDGAGVGAARGFEMVGPKAELADTVGEAAAEALALVLETERDGDWSAAKTTATGITITMEIIATQRQKLEER